MGRCIIVILFCLSVSAKDKISIITCMVPQQLESFRKSTIEPYAVIEGIDVDVINVEEIGDIEGLVKKRRDVALFMVPFGKAWSMVERGVVQPLSPHLSRQEERVFEEEYILTWLGRRGDEQYFLPHKYETRIMAYRKSKVAAAVEAWKSRGALRDSIAGLVRSVNGSGLPKGYDLETDPESWDFFDVLVLGLVWSGMPGANKDGRVGHRAKRYSGTALRIIDRVYQCGGDSLTMLSMNGDPVIDAFTWEAVYTALGVYNSAMIKKQWSGSSLWSEFNRETIYLSFLTQVDCFSVHGSVDQQQPGYPADPQDLGFATMPQGCSIECKPDSTVKRTGTKTITNGGWWWAVPSGCKEVHRSYELFEHLSSRDNQLRECAAFGMIPVRNDVLKNDRLLLHSGWISDVYRVSYQQIKINNNTVVPAQGEFDAVSDLYLDAWNTIVCERRWAEKRGQLPDRNAISALIGEKFIGRANRVFEERR